jgi:hypothetical protein
VAFFATSISQEAATVAYEDNDGCTAMGNAQKPTPRTQHIDIKYFALCNWVERDLIHLDLDRIIISINVADQLTKILSRILFHRHADYLLGHIPHNILLYINKLFLHTATITKRKLISSFPIRSLPPSPQKPHGSSHLHMKTSKVIRGSASFGMSVQSKPTFWIVWVMILA